MTCDQVANRTLVITSLFWNPCWGQIIIFLNLKPWPLIWTLCTNQIQLTLLKSHPQKLEKVAISITVSSQELFLQEDTKKKNRVDVHLWRVICQSLFNSMNPNISIQILHTVFYSFPWVMPRSIFTTIKSFLMGDHFLYSHDLNVWARHCIVRRN